eukprot:TRINITY_DN15529_c0_g1_i1.p1 TRINITY_DN15529_c0_g1~~TRINITY_DN15529_c0_g1_i1.p1  ORF type:complete len:348 (+),score=66.76 TRINITY_DN15529_c0_g1_i1:263-1306(+)
MLSPDQLATIGALTSSVVSSVSIVLCNKQLMSGLKFNFGTTLTAWHLFVTFIFLHCARHFNFFEHKAMEFKPLLYFGILNGASIGLLNLSLGFNSVGFYQMTKLAIIPFTVFFETILFGKHFSRQVQLSLVMLLVGVGIATVTDVELNFLGSVLSVLAIVTTCFGQILTNTLQRQHKVSSTQFLYQSSPIMAGALQLTGPMLDQYLTGQSVFYFDYTTTVEAVILLSCTIAILVNLSTFLVLGKTSPVTYQVLGHLKTCLVLALGFVAFKTPVTFRNILGICIALGGMVYYSYVSIQEAKKKAVMDKLDSPKPKEPVERLSTSKGGSTNDLEALLDGAHAAREAEGR